MPLLRRQVLQKVFVTERLKDGDEVFFCQPTGEMFSSYEDYFQRIMLISSMVWSCAMTGRPNLTYSEALDSEKAARKLLKTFPAAVKGPFLLVASHTKRSSINEMHEDVYSFVKDQLFKGEIVDALHEMKKVIRRAVIANVLVDSASNRLMYQVVANDNTLPKAWIVPPENLKRDRSSLTRDKCKLFLKQHVEAGPGGQLRIKADSLSKYVIEEGWTDDQVFFGKVPDFEQSKKLKMLAERTAGAPTSKPKKKPAVAKDGKPGAAAMVTDGKQQTKSKNQKKDRSAGTEKGKKKKGVKGKQQGKGSDTAAAPNNEARSKQMAEEMEALRRKVEQQALVKKRHEEEKALLLQQATLALKKYNAVLEDQELTDQRPMPPVRPVQSLIAPKYFSTYVFILEFLNSFADLLSIRSKFSNGLTMHLLERALILREVNGPLSDIFQVLLSAIFTQQVDEENELDMRIDRVENLSQKRYTVPEQVRAHDVAVWCKKHYCVRLNELPMDSMTVSELLRLHFLSSGAVVGERATRHRFYNRGGYTSTDDPGMRLVQEHPHIFRALKLYSVYQLPVGDIIKILCCLIHQLLTYTGVRELVEERLERARTARISYQATRQDQRRLTLKTSSQKNQAREEMRKELAAYAGEEGAAKEAHRKKLQDKLNEQCAGLDVEAQRQMKQLEAKSNKLKEDFFDYQIYLGTDRCFRNYWLFESLPGLFVEHDRTFAGRCLDHATPNNPGLAQCAPEQRKKFITKAIMTCAGTDGVAGLLDAKAINGSNADGESDAQLNVYEQLLRVGSAKLEHIERKQRLLMEKKPAGQLPVRGEEQPEVTGTTPETIQVPRMEDGVKPLPHPTNHELFMCTADPDDCPVHTPLHGQTISWGVYSTAEQLDALIQSLNSRGVREKQLRDTLECERDLIVTHIENCPLLKLSVDASNRESILADVAYRNQKRYDAPNFSFEKGTEPNEILEAVFREHLLELEAKITVGYLGAMRVHNRDRWRDAIEGRSYDPQTDEPLQWGPRRLAKQQDDGGGGGGERDREQEASEAAGKDDEHDSENDSEWDDVERLLSDVNDPGYGLPDTAVSMLDETLDTEDVAYPLHDSDALRNRVHSLARALLQVAQCIDPKFLRHPFGPKKDHKDKSVMMQWQYYGQKNLVKWEVSLMRSTCYAQLFLHYNVLSDAIHWSRSAERMSCMICRRKGDPGLTLLCDECNRACHTYCLKPKLKKVPAGDWYCMRCRPANFKVQSAPAKKKRIFKWKEDEDVQDLAEEEEEEEEEEEVEVVVEEEEEEEEEADGEDNEEEDDEEEEEEEEEEEDDEEGEAEAEEAEEDGNEDEDEDEEESEEESESGEDGEEDNGSDEDYQTGRKRSMAKARPRPGVGRAVASASTSSGRNKRKATVANGSGYGDDDEDDEYARRRRNSYGLVLLPNGAGRHKDRKRTATMVETSQKRKRQGTPESSVNASKRTRRNVPDRASGSNGQRKGSPRQDSDGEGSKGPRTSARSNKGQRRSGPANGDTTEGEETSGFATGGASRRSRRTGDDLPLNSVALYTLIDDILKHPQSWPFNRPVSAKEVPDYYAVIKQPMDFARIKSKLNMGDYKINEQMLNDVQLVFRNCDLYNTDETDVYRIGRDLERYVVKRCKQLTLPFLPSDMQKSDSHQNGPSGAGVVGNGLSPHGK
ncbi:bromodomain adjacent to zinc finger domain protein 1A [Anopheles nili]|uniref:bromodomain adjacent to zinc finger domain protein 1A n=1 Tax=Anopheles nili TaxID=185578 RepID=UPI00237B2BB3|nr:bromodomain adjacent to zinc finger domain protein 1A [Anopheles nili]